MLIKVKLYAHLKKYRDNQPIFDLEVPAQTSVRALMDIIGIPPGEIGVTIVNGKLSRDDVILQDGDALEFTPIVAGG